MSVQLLRRKFTVDQYHKMVDSGILNEDDRVELIRGEIIEMSPIGQKHAACVAKLSQLLTIALLGRAIIWSQNPIKLSNSSEPQPDIALLKPRDDFYYSVQPQPQDIFLLIEVADSTIKYDREIKIPLYAEEAIEEVWLVDLNQQSVEVYREVAKDGYKNVQKLSRGEYLRFQPFADIKISIDEILGSSVQK